MIIEPNWLSATKLRLHMNKNHETRSSQCSGATNLLKIIQRSFSSGSGVCETESRYSKPVKIILLNSLISLILHSGVQESTPSQLRLQAGYQNIAEVSLKTWFHWHFQPMLSLRRVNKSYMATYLLTVASKNLWTAVSSLLCQISHRIELPRQILLHRRPILFYAQSWRFSMKLSQF